MIEKALPESSAMTKTRQDNCMLHKIVPESHTNAPGVLTGEVSPVQPLLEDSSRKNVNSGASADSGRFFR